MNIYMANMGSYIQPSCLDEALRLIHFMFELKLSL